MTKLVLGIVAAAWLTTIAVAGMSRASDQAHGVTQAVSTQSPSLEQNTGYISFWIRPSWDGDDRRVHRVLRIGDPDTNGILVEKAANGMLRYVMTAPGKRTAARADVSRWQAGEWHHVVVAWFSKDGMPIGLPLWVDKVCVAGPIFGADAFFDPEQLDDKKVYWGDEAADFTVAEVIFRDDHHGETHDGLVACVYRDYFRSAPFDAIGITHKAQLIDCETRVVAGQKKQFALTARRAGQWEYVTEHSVRYPQWGNHDAKPFITWTTSDDAVATVDKNGRVTGVSIGKCQLTAEFRGMSDSYALEVISIDQPDLDVTFVERLPRYPARALRNMPIPGDKVQSVAHIDNYGYQVAPAGAVVRFELFEDVNRNYELDADEMKPVQTQEQVIHEAMSTRGERTVTFDWVWPEAPVFVGVTLDPDNKIAEICEANNRCCELNIARPMHHAYTKERQGRWYDEKIINHIGSFNHADWVVGQNSLFNRLYPAAVWPTTTPIGITDRVRVDLLMEFLPDIEFHEQPWEKNKDLFDGGFPINERVDPLAVDAAIIHEFGHTCSALPDLYGYPVRVPNVLLEDADGDRYAGTALWPEVANGNLPFPWAMNVPCGVGYSPLMDACRMWFHPTHAGQIQHFAGYRGDKFWGWQGRLVPQQNVIQVLDINDAPLPGAAVYVYHVTNTDCRESKTKFFADRPKFAGITDDEGGFRIPDKTLKCWDDPATDVVEGETAAWNPFAGAAIKDDPLSDIAFTPNVYSVEGLLLIKMVSGDQVEFAWLDLTQFNYEYYSGNQPRGVYEMRTSLTRSDKPTALDLPRVPSKLHTTNEAPIAVTDNKITVRSGRNFTLRGNRSHDPEGQPLEYRWEVRHWAIKPERGTGKVFKAKAPVVQKDETYEAFFFVIDGVRPSKPVEIKIHVKK